MKMTITTAMWKNALLGMSCLISIAATILISCGVAALGGANFAAGAYMITAIGSLVYIISFLGCFAALREAYILSMAVVVTSTVCIIVQTVFMISFAVMKSTLMEQASERVSNLWEQELIHPGAMHALQLKHNCCGKDSAQDYLQDDDDVLPKSCCLHMNCTNIDYINAKGCSGMLLSYFDTQSDNLILTIVGSILLEALGLVSAYYMGKGVQHNVKKVEQIFITEE